MAKRFIDSPQILDSTNEDLIPETPPESPYKNLGSKTPMTWRQRKLNNSDKVFNSNNCILGSFLFNFLNSISFHKKPFRLVRDQVEGKELGGNARSIIFESLHWDPQFLADSAHPHFFTH